MGQVAELQPIYYKSAHEREAVQISGLTPGQVADYCDGCRGCEANFTLNDNVGWFLVPNGETTCLPPAWCLFSQAAAASLQPQFIVLRPAEHAQS